MSYSRESGTFTEGDWVVVHPQRLIGKILEESSLWENTFYRVWLPSSDSIIRVEASDLRPVQSSAADSYHLSYLATAARIADALTQDVLLAPLGVSVIPLPHQIRALKRAISGNRVRYLLADEVGLGKTIEAGLIMRELKLRGLVRRTLVVAPKGLVRQWVAEMRTHFGERFYPVFSADYAVLKRLASDDAEESVYTSPGEAERRDSWPFPVFESAPRNPFRAWNQIVVSMDSVKPPYLSRGKAWERFGDLIHAGWDLVIVDEAHRLGGSTDRVARYKLGLALCEAAPYLLLLSATPHQGKSDHFRRLMSLLDPDAFPDEESITQTRVQPYVIRTEKRRAIDAEGKPLFKPRLTKLVSVFWEERHLHQELLYQAVTEYVRKGYHQARAEKRHAIGFLLILMQRLVASSTRAIRTTLERRLEALTPEQELLPRLLELDEEDWAEMDGQEQLDMLLQQPMDSLWGEEQRIVRSLLMLATQCEQQGPDAKAEALIDWIYRLQAEEGDPELKVLIFTEFVATQQMLYEFLTERGFHVVCLNGSMDLEERKRAQNTFAEEARIMISTDAGGEGLNLQFCHVVINYDIPWNPMRLEQRIGRVDRIGQTRTVRALNFVLGRSVEHRVLEVLEKKLDVIFRELGVDKTGDVLDSAQAEHIFDELFVEAILDPEHIDTRIDAILKPLEEELREARERALLLGTTEELDPDEARQLLTHPFPHWVEHMTVSYLRAHGGRAERNEGTWDLTWPDGFRLSRVVFTRKEAEEYPSSRHLTLEHPRVRGLVMRLPVFARGQPIPVVRLPGLAADIQGYWSLWRISLSAVDWNRHRMMPLFLADNGRVFIPTARYIWERLLASQPELLEYLDDDTSQEVFRQLQKTAQRQGRTMYEDLLQTYRQYLEREREKGLYAFAARRKAIERIGLPQVRNHRLRLLEQEEQRFKEQLEHRAHILPEMEPVLLMRIEP